jgi:ABC-type glycerol-3-phosphate transport system permease component
MGEHDAAAGRRLARILMKEDPENAHRVGHGHGHRGDQYGILLAAATLGSIPIIVVFLIFQRQMISGLTSGACKGVAA